jgi:hypothetical protein
VVLVSELPPEDVRLMRMIPAKSLEEGLQHVSLTDQGYLMPAGTVWLPVANN